jgi:hypothetical protein
VFRERVRRVVAGRAGRAHFILILDSDERHAGELGTSLSPMCPG